MNPNHILSKNKISIKRVKGKDNVIREIFSLQFTFPKGCKHQITGTTTEEIKEKLYCYFNTRIITFNELGKMWIDELTKNNTKSKKIIDCRYSLSFLSPYVGNKIINDITVGQLQICFQYIKKQGKKAATINSIIGRINQLYEFAIEKGYLEDNIVKRVVRYRSEYQFERKYLNDREVFQFLNKCHSHDKGNLYSILILSGIPLDFLLAISWKDVDFDNKLIAINKSNNGYPNPIIKSLDKCNCYIDYQPEFVMNFFKEELKRQSIKFGKDLVTLKESNKLIFYKDDLGSPISRHIFESRLASFIKDKLNENYSPMDIFFTSAVIAFKAGCDLTTLISIIGKKRAIEMFRNPTKYDCFYTRQTTGINDYFDNVLEEVIDKNDNPISFV